LYSDLDQSTIEIVDAFEDIIYVRCMSNVITTSGDLIKANVYVISDKFRHKLSDMPWSLAIFRDESLGRYLEVCERFYEEYNSKHMA